MDTPSDGDVEDSRGLPFGVGPGAAEPTAGTPANEPRARPDTSRAGSGRWVESSWELSSGLTVHEGLPPDAGLDDWLEAQLRR